MLVVVAAVTGLIAVTVHGGVHKFPGSRIVVWPLVAVVSYLLAGQQAALLALLVFGGFRLGEHGPFLTMGTTPRIRAATSEWGKLFEKLSNDVVAFAAIKAAQLIPAMAFAAWAYGSSGVGAVLAFAAVLPAAYAVAARIDLNDGTFVAEVATGLLFGAVFIAGVA